MPIILVKNNKKKREYERFEPVTLKLEIKNKRVMNLTRNTRAHM